MSQLKPHYFDKTKIDKVVMNLLSNAVKFTPAGGKVIMRLWDAPSPPSPLPQGERGEPILKLQIEDTGIGIPEHLISHVFERFMQVDTSSTRPYGGLGIGLSLVQELVRQHGGWVDVESRLGHGSRFTINLPRGREHFRAAIIEEKTRGPGKRDRMSVASLVEIMRESRWEAPPDSAQGMGDTVLVVDDNADMRSALYEILKKKFRVSFGTNGEEGVRFAREQMPDLVVSDVMMPKKDGYGLVRDLKADPKTREIPVILITAKSGEESLVEGFVSGADDYVSKPFPPSELLLRVENLLRIKRQQERIEGQAGIIMEIASQVAHDIQSPLSSIKVAIDQLKEIPSGASARADYLNLLELSAKRLTGIAEDLLKKQADEKRDRVVFSIHKVLDELIGEYSSNKKSKGIRYRKEFNHAINCLGRRERVQRAFGNLIKNAIEAMKGVGEIFIRSSIEGSFGVVTIADTGCGMSPETLRHVLDGGFTKGKRGGHGIGMKVVKEVIEEHGWKLEVRSLPGQGTTFTIRFPMPDSGIVDRMHSTEEGSGFFELSLRADEVVVVIDDDPSVRLQWELIARKKGFQVRVFESWEAYQGSSSPEPSPLAGEETPPLVGGDGRFWRPEGAAGRRPGEGTAIVDYHFDNSELTGVEVIERLKARGFDTLYLCTAEYWKPLIQQQARDLGVSVCPKPIPRVAVNLTPSPSPTTESVDSGPLSRFRERELATSVSVAGEGGEGKYNVLVIDDDHLIGLTWRALKQRLKIRDLHYFPNLEAFKEAVIASKIDPASLDIAFVDRQLKGSDYSGQAVADYLKGLRLKRVVMASGEQGIKVPDSIEDLIG